MDRVWYSLDWFSPAVLRGFEWEHPLWLYAPVGVLLLWVVSSWVFRRRGWKFAWGQADTLVRDWSAWIRHINTLVLLLSVSALAIALARPQLTRDHVEQWSEGIDIMLVLDISESMKIEDFTPNRLRAAKDVAKKFVESRGSDRIGLVVFSGEAFAKTPLTQDHELVQSEIESIEFGLISSPGTAIGSSLATATNRMREAEAKSKVIILLSDGDNTAGQIDPLTAAKLAEAYGIKIYSIAIGREGRVPFGRDFFGRKQYIENSLDETTLREIATIGHGKFYRASDKQTLSKIFKEIDVLEKSEIKELSYKQRSDYYYPYVQWGLILFLMYMGLKPWIGNPLND